MWRLPRHELRGTSRERPAESTGVAQRRLTNDICGNLLRPQQRPQNLKSFVRRSLGDDRRCAGGSFASRIEGLAQWINSQRGLSS